MLKELLIRVDEHDNEIGTVNKMDVHVKGLLHRAFSLFVFNPAGQLLLQKRDKKKYHSGGLWSNSCCSHPVAGENMEHAVKRRINEEMGIASTAHFLFKFIYKVQFENGLTEHELDHVFIGFSNEIPQPDSNEVEDWRYIFLDDLKREMHLFPDTFTFWLRKCLPLLQQQPLFRNYLASHCKGTYAI